MTRRIFHSGKWLFVEKNNYITGMGINEPTKPPKYRKLLVEETFTSAPPLSTLFEAFCPGRLCYIPEQEWSPFSSKNELPFPWRMISLLCYIPEQEWTLFSLKRVYLVKSLEETEKFYPLWMTVEKINAALLYIKWFWKSLLSVNTISMQYSRTRVQAKPEKIVNL